MSSFRKPGRKMKTWNICENFKQIIFMAVVLYSLQTKLNIISKDPKIVLWKNSDSTTRFTDEETVKSIITCLRIHIHQYWRSWLKNKSSNFRVLSVIVFHIYYLIHTHTPTHSLFLCVNEGERIILFWNNKKTLI